MQRFAFGGNEIMSEKRVCYKCLLRDMEDTQKLESMEVARNRIHEADKVTDAEYERRLSICKECEFLLEGTCLKCGCYVELRAAAKALSCPNVPKFW